MDFTDVYGRCLIHTRPNARSVRATGPNSVYVSKDDGIDDELLRYDVNALLHARPGAGSAAGKCSHPKPKRSQAQWSVHRVASRSPGGWIAADPGRKLDRWTREQRTGGTNRRLTSVKPPASDGRRCCRNRPSSAIITWRKRDKARTAGYRNWRV